MALRIGTSGWQYRDWRGDFYPARLATARWLGEYATVFDTVEVNNSFYRLPAPGTFARWADTTPAEFCFAVKASRFLTHMKRLRDPAEPVALLLERASELGPKLGPVLLQLPPRFRADPAGLDASLAAFGGRVRVAVEVRDPSWHDDAVYEVLAGHGAALCWWDRLGRHGPLVRTADWAYLRLHEGRAHPQPRYGRTALETWARRLRDAYGDDADGYVYCNNDPHACAPRNASELARIAERLGMAVHRPERPVARP